MKFKKKELLLGVLLGTGLHLLDNLREHLPDNMDDIKGRARETYETASDRLGRATNVLRGKEDSRVLGKVCALLIGVGIGVGVGLLVAPASREETRADLTDKVSDFKDKVRERAAKPQGATGTHGGRRAKAHGQTTAEGAVVDARRRLRCMPTPRTILKQSGQHCT